MITLIGESLAKEGSSFIFYGPSEACESCRFKLSCVDSLEMGRKYIIQNVKDITQNCATHEGGIARVVEVELDDIEGLIDSKKAFEGSRISYTPPECDLECVFRKCCFPEGLFANDKCIIAKNVGKHTAGCGKQYLLTRVVLSLG